MAGVTASPSPISGATPIPFRARCASDSDILPPSPPLSPRAGRGRGPRIPGIKSGDEGEEQRVSAGAGGLRIVKPRASCAASYSSQPSCLRRLVWPAVLAQCRPRRPRSTIAPIGSKDRESPAVPRRQTGESPSAYALAATECSIQREARKVVRTGATRLFLQLG